jgi:deazaflavin-dependent oxidoreductase (nitroreductase family)
MEMTKPNLLIRLFWDLHLKLYVWSAGRIGHTIRNLPVLILTTKGKKTGLLRPKALMYLPYGDDFVVIASNLGQAQHPAWWINLLAEPVAAVQVGNLRYTVHVREADGEEREKLWNLIVAKNSDYEQYRTWTSRRIPVVVLERVQSKPPEHKPKEIT